MMPAGRKEVLVWVHSTGAAGAAPEEHPTLKRDAVYAQLAALRDAGLVDLLFPKSRDARWFAAGQDTRAYVARVQSRRAKRQEVRREKQRAYDKNRFRHSTRKLMAASSFEPGEEPFLHIVRPATDAPPIRPPRPASVFYLAVAA